MVDRFVSDVFGVKLERAEEIIKDLTQTLFTDPTIINEEIFIDYIRSKYKGSELEFALYTGAKASEVASGRSTPPGLSGKGLLGRLFKA